MPRSCIKISDTVMFRVPRSASSSHSQSPVFGDCSPYVFNIVRCCAYCSLSRTWVTFNRSLTIFEAFLPHFYLCCTHCIVPETLNHLNSFCGGIFKLNSKLDAESLLYSLSHCECDGHTVHMLPQRRLPPPLISTMKSSLFTHAHSSPLSLAASLHQCCANHSCYITKGWSFSRQTSYN